MSIDFHETKNPKTFWEAVEYILNHFRISIQILSNGMDFFDVALVWSGANIQKEEDHAVV